MCMILGHSICNSGHSHICSNYWVEAVLSCGVWLSVWLVWTCVGLTSSKITIGRHRLHGQTCNALSVLLHCHSVSPKYGTGHRCKVVKWATRLSTVRPPELVHFDCLQNILYHIQDTKRNSYRYEMQLVLYMFRNKYIWGFTWPNNSLCSRNLVESVDSYGYSHFQISEWKSIKYMKCFLLLS